MRLYFADPNNNDLALRPEIRELSAGLKSWDRVGLIRAVLAELGKGREKTAPFCRQPRWGLGEEGEL